ncbi:hypothetical protein LCGC14_2167140 [marine sediment metagenome]|uniref:HTH merR-type domain-containing protein n=1 Tax=marine sediment metagenome TaxID=412755 RepID=A0A0F9DQZ4_9ZZZZ
MSEQKSKRLMKLGEAALAAAVSKQTIEYYIMLGLVNPITPPGTRRRFFDKKIIQRIRLIRELNDTGYTLREIRQTWLKRR